MERFDWHSAMLYAVLLFLIASCLGGCVWDARDGVESAAGAAAATGGNPIAILIALITGGLGEMGRRKVMKKVMKPQKTERELELEYQVYTLQDEIRRLKEKTEILPHNQT